MLLENVKSLCKSRGITIWRLENLISIGNGCIARWDKGFPNSDSLVKVADYFGVSTDYLLGRDRTWLSADGQLIATVFDLLPNQKQDLVKQYVKLLQLEEKNN